MDFVVGSEGGKTLQQVPCCVCGTMIYPNDACLCVACLQLESSMENKNEEFNELIQCKSCDRWCSHIGKDTWVQHQFDSPGLLALCLRRVSSAGKAKILDAAWIWTEPHSRRLKLFVDIEQAVMDGKMNVQQRIVAEFTIKTKMCPDCIRSESDHSWGAVIQLRQRINHQRSLILLEAQLTKAGMHNLMIGVEKSKQGMDFFFKQKNQAEKVVNFISSHLPVKVKFSKKHISTDSRTNKPRYEWSYAVDVVPLGKGDLVLMPMDLNAKNSTACEINIVSKVASSVHVTNPVTLKRDELLSSRYFSKEKFIRLLMSPPELVRFVVLDIEPIDPMQLTKKGSGDTKNIDKEAGGVLSDAEVARESDLGSNDTIFHIRTHLGHLLSPGDIALGYDMVRYASSGAIEGNLWMKYRHYKAKGRDVHVPDIILVKKAQDDQVKKKSKSKYSGRNSSKRLDEGMMKNNDDRDSHAEDLSITLENCDDVEDEDEDEFLMSDQDVEDIFTHLVVNTESRNSNTPDAVT